MVEPTGRPCLEASRGGQRSGARYSCRSSAMWVGSGLFDACLTVVCYLSSRPPPTGEKMRLNILGGPEVLDPSGGRVAVPLEKPLALLAYLVVRGEPVSRDELAEILWPDTSSGLPSVREALATVKRLLTSDTFADTEPVRLGALVLSSDFADLSDPAIMPERLLSLWRGDLLQAFPRIDAPRWLLWLAVQRALARSRYSRRLSDIAFASLLKGDAATAALLLERVVEVEPHGSGGWRALIRTRLDQGDPSAALTACGRAHFALAGVVHRRRDEVLV